MDIQLHSVHTLEPVNLFKEGVVGNMSISSDITGVSEGYLDVNFWLPMCASTLNISKELKDYVCIPVVGFFSDIPNTNGDSISKKELLRWDTECGCAAYKTFKGKPTHVEHDNKIHDRAKGVIFDSYISPLKQYNGNHAKVVLLAGFDRSKDPALVASILSGANNRYSIGAKFERYICSITGNMYGDPHGSQYTRPGVPTYMTNQGDLVYRSLVNIRGFELSSVATPAFCTAVSDKIIS